MAGVGVGVELRDGRVRLGPQDLDVVGQSQIPARGRLGAAIICSSGDGRSRAAGRGGGGRGRRQCGRGGSQLVNLTLPYHVEQRQIFRVVKLFALAVICHRRVPLIRDCHDGVVPGLHVWVRGYKGRKLGPLICWCDEARMVCSDGRRLR